jgi:hypothetical protein
VRRRQITMVLCVASLLATPVAAQVQVGGFVEYDNITYPRTPNEQKVNSRNQGILQLELSYRANTTAEAFGAVEFRADQADPSRSRTYLDEVYLNLYAGNLDLRAGKQIYAWGRADAFNPTDNLSVWDFSDPLDTGDEKIGAVSIRADYYVGNWTLEGVLAPSFTPSVLPDSSSRWFPMLPPTISNPGYPAAGNRSIDASYTWADPVLPDEGLESTQYAIKVSGTVTGWDLSISWFDGYDDLPGLHTTVTADSTLAVAEVVLQPQYHRRRAIGADFATTFGKFGLRGEAAYYLTDDWDGNDPAIDDPYGQYTLGLDYTFRDVFPDKDLFLLVEWIHEVQVPDRGTHYRITDLNHVFRKSLVGKADLHLGQFATVKLEGVWNVYAGDWWLRPGLFWSVADGLELQLDVDLLGGPDDSFFGTFRDNRRIQGRLKYSF